MKLNKRGIELSLNMVVIIAIVLVVLIVAIIIFSGGAQQFVEKLKEITAQIWTAKPDLAGKGV
ncbi:MAG: hypothetical protein KJ955_07025 [Nanoarchaeota archaeon]|nr:hypothetical protein [Nanoarchaeota archaeon]